MPPAATLATTAGQVVKDTTDIWYAVGLLFIVTIIGGVIIAQVARRLRKPETLDAAFTLHDLRVLKGQGKINEAEYERMKATLLDAFAKTDTPGTDPTQDNVQ